MTDNLLQQCESHVRQAQRMLNKHLLADPALLGTTILHSLICGLSVLK